jgi:hypothetical protein
MDNKLTNLFTYLKSHNDYRQAFDKMKRIFNPYFGNITNYNLIEDTFIECLIPAIHYFNDKQDVGRIKNILYYNCLDLLLENRSDFDKIEENIYNEISIEIHKIRNNFSCLKYYNFYGIELNNQESFRKNVYQFLEDIHIWKLEGEEGWDEWQYEWDIEYFKILNIVYHCNSLEEVNDVYKLVWFLWLGKVHPKGIIPEAKIIWENLPEWKIRMDKMLIRK